MAGEGHQLTLDAVEGLLGARLTGAETLGDLLVEVLEEACAGLPHIVLDLRLELALELLELAVDFLWRAGRAVDLGDAFLEIDPGADVAEDIVAGAEDALEELVFLVQ